MKIKKLFQLMWNTKKAKEHLYKITILKQILKEKKKKRNQKPKNLTANEKNTIRKV